MANPFENYTGVLKTIRPTELAQHTSEGWSVIDAFDEERLVNDWGKLPRAVPHSQPQYGADDGTVNISTSHVVRERFFVVRQDPESELAKRGNQLSAMRTERDEALRSVAALKTLSDKQTQDIAQLNSDVERQREIAGSLRTQRTADVEKIRKMEGDLGKVRAAIGEIRMRDLLGEGT